jgi:hypothetical protein
VEASLAVVDEEVVVDVQAAMAGVLVLEVRTEVLEMEGEYYRARS